MPDGIRPAQRCTDTATRYVISHTAPQPDLPVVTDPNRGER